MKKVLFVATVVKTHIMQFHLPYLAMFKAQGWETAVAARNDYADPADCVIPHCDTFYDIPFSRSVGSRDNITAYRALKKLLREEHFDLIHCHTPVGAALARLAARKARKSGTRVIYTAHGFHFFKGAALKNWLLYYPAEKCLAPLTDTLLTINREDHDIARKKFRCRDVRYVPGVGVDLSRFVPMPEVRQPLREKLGLAADAPVLLSVGELIDRKNHRLILEAMADPACPPEVRLLLVGDGAKRQELEALAKELGLEERVHFLGYRKDIPELCAAADLFVFMSKQEGLPVALMEALAAGLPAVCTRIRGNTDLLKPGVNGAFCAAEPRELAETVAAYFREPEKFAAADYRERRQAVEPFGLEKVETVMREVYGFGKE